MIRFSAALVVAGLGLLLVGALTSELPLVYAAIGVSVIAAIMLAIGVVAGRDEIFGRDAAAAGDRGAHESAGNGRASAPGAAQGSAAAPADDRIPAGKTAAGRVSGQEGAAHGSAPAARGTLSGGPTPLAGTGPAAASAAAASFVAAPAVASPPARHGETTPESPGAILSAGSPADASSSGLGWPAGKSPADELWARVDAELSAAGAASQAPKLTKDSATHEVWERVELELTKPPGSWNAWEQVPPPASLAPPAPRSPAPPPFVPPAPPEQETARPWEPPAALSGPAQAKPAPASDPALPALPRRPAPSSPSAPGQASSWADEWPAFKEAPGWTIERAGRYAEPDEPAEAPQASAAPAAADDTAVPDEPASTPEPATGEASADQADEPVRPSAVSTFDWSRKPVAGEKPAEAGTMAGESEPSVPDQAGEPGGTGRFPRFDWSRKPAADDELTDTSPAAGEAGPSAGDEADEPVRPGGVPAFDWSRKPAAEEKPAEAGESVSSVRDRAGEPGGTGGFPGFDWSRTPAAAGPGGDEKLADTGSAAGESEPAARDQAGEPGGTGRFPAFDWSRPSEVAAEAAADAEPEAEKLAEAATDDRGDSPEQDSEPAKATGSFAASGSSGERDTEPEADGEGVSAPSASEPEQAGGGEPDQAAEGGRTGAFSAFGWSGEPSGSSGPGAAAGGSGDQAADTGGADPAAAAEASGKPPGGEPGEPAAGSSVSAFGWAREPEGPSANAEAAGAGSEAGLPRRTPTGTGGPDVGLPRRESALGDATAAPRRAASEGVPRRGGIEAFFSSRTGFESGSAAASGGAGSSGRGRTAEPALGADDGATATGSGSGTESGTHVSGWAPPSLGNRITASGPGAPLGGDSGPAAVADDTGLPRRGIAEVLSGGRSASGSGTHASGWPSSPADRTVTSESALARNVEKDAALGGGAAASDPRLPRRGAAANAELQFGLGRRPVAPSDGPATDRGAAGAAAGAAAEETAPDTDKPKPDDTVSAKYQVQFGLGRRTAPGREPAAAGEAGPSAETHFGDSPAPDTGSAAAGGWGLLGNGGALSEAAPGAGRAGTGEADADKTSAADMAGATERAPAFGGAVRPGKPDAAPDPSWGAAPGTTPGMVAKPGHVIVVQGVPRYHKSGCILIRFLGQNDLEQLTREAAEAAGCVPCRACQPDKSGIMP